MNGPILLYYVADGIATLTLNRPEKRNALSAALVQALKDALARAGADENLADARSLGALFVAPRALSKPVVAVVQGRALAGGCGLATACDVVLASADAEFGYPEVHLGFVPAMVMAILRRKVPESRAFDLVARGHRIGASEAHSIGLVNQVYPPSGFQEGVERGARVNVEARVTEACREGVRRYLERSHESAGNGPNGPRLGASGPTRPGRP